MKTLVFSVAFCATAVAFGGTCKCIDTNACSEATCAEAKCAEKCRGKATVSEAADIAKTAVKTPEQRKTEMEARRKAHMEARETAEKKAAEKQGITVDEYRAQKKAKHEEMMARRLGMSVEEFRKMTPEQRRMKSMGKRDEMMAKKLGISVEEFKKLTPEERKAKIVERRLKRMAEHKATKEAKPTEAPTTEAAK